MRSGTDHGASGNCRVGGGGYPESRWWACRGTGRRKRGLGEMRWGQPGGRMSALGTRESTCEEWSLPCSRIQGISTWRKQRERRRGKTEPG